jgi:hypothetical protein
MPKPRYLSPTLADALDSLTPNQCEGLHALAKRLGNSPIERAVRAMADEAELRRAIREMDFITIAHDFEAEQAAEAEAIADRLMAEGKLSRGEDRTVGTAWWPMGGEPE